MTAEAFTKENRVRLFFQIKDSLNSDHGGGLKSFQTLEDLLKRDLGRLELAKAYDLESRIQNFVLSAPENELLTVIEFVPIAHYGAKTEGRSNAYNNIDRFVLRDAEHEAKQIAKGLNDFLEAVGHPARFVFEPAYDFRRDGIPTYSSTN